MSGWRVGSWGECERSGLLVLVVVRVDPGLDLAGGLETRPDTLMTAVVENW